jgi:protein-tyrosine phosphatase
VDLCQIDDDAKLFISAAIEDWSPLEAHSIDVIIDLEGGLDACIPTMPERCLYVYFPIYDDDQQIPTVSQLRAIARMAAILMQEGHVVLSHCRMGYNRSAFVAGLILVELGMSGREAVARLRARRPGALYNPIFAEYLESLPAPAGSSIGAG